MILTLIWMAASMVGLAFSAFGLIDAFFDLRALGSITNGRRRLAMTDLKSQLGLLMTEVIWLALGSFALLGQLNGEFVAMALVATNIVIALVAAVRYYDHAALIARIAREKEEKENEES